MVEFIYFFFEKTVATEHDRIFLRGTQTYVIMSGGTISRYTSIHHHPRPLGLRKTLLFDNDLALADACICALREFVRACVNMLTSILFTVAV